MENEQDRTQSFIPLRNGTQIRHYEIIKKIGAGGMGEVYLADDLDLNRKVALKFLHPNLCQDDDCRKRFKREAQAAAGLNHPNIISIHEVNEYKSRPYFVMDYVEGQSLKELLNIKELDIERIIDISIQLCDALNSAHQKGVIHRDIKPSNIVLDAYGRPLILDFGLAAVKGSDQLTKTGSTMGTVRYMSPEQVDGKTIDNRSDLFSFGVVLYEMITGKSPFARDNDMAIGLSILNDSPEPLAKYRRNIDDELQRLVFKLLEKDPALRYQSAAGIISDLKRMIPSTRSTFTLTPERRLPKKIIGITTVITSVILLSIWLFFLSDDKKTGNSDRKMLAVLPFTNLAEEDKEYFADGITEEIISRLAAIKNLGVISRTSVHATYKNSDKTLPQIASELGVEYILEGTIRWDKTGNTELVRITPRLIRVNDDVPLWVENYERPLTQIFAVQTEIATQIVNNMGITLGRLENERLKTNPTENIEAYNLFLKGTYFLSKQSVEGFRQGKAYYDKALALDSNFALAWAGLSVYHTFVLMTGIISVEETYPHALHAADKALELDSLLCEAHIAKGWVHSYMEWDWVNAELEFKRAIELGPGSAFAHVAYATFLLPMNRNDEAIREMQTALILDPVSPFVNQVYGWTYFISGMLDEAITQYHKTLELDPLNIWAHTQLAWTYAYKNRFDEALAQCDTVLNILKPEFDPWLLSSLASVYAMTGQEEPTRTTLANLKEIAKESYIDPFNFACLYAALNEKKLALEWLEKAIINHSINVYELFNTKYNNLFLKNLSNEIKYKQLVEQTRSENTKHN